MAEVVRMSEGSVLKLKVENGVNAKGTIQYAVRTIADVNSKLSDADALQLATDIGKLQKYTVHSVHRSDTAQLGEKV